MRPSASRYSLNIEGDSMTNDEVLLSNWRVEQLKNFTGGLMDGTNDGFSLIAQFTHRVANDEGHAPIQTWRGLSRRRTRIDLGTRTTKNTVTSSANNRGGSLRTYIQRNSESIATTEMNAPRKRIIDVAFHHQTNPWCDQVHRWVFFLLSSSSTGKRRREIIRTKTSIETHKFQYFFNTFKPVFFRHISVQS